MDRIFGDHLGGTLTGIKQRFMAKQRRVIGAKEKAKVALAACREQNISRELSVQFKVHQTQIVARKKKLIDEAPSIFERGYSGSREQEFQHRKAQLSVWRLVA